MAKDSVQTTVRLPVALFSRLNELVPNGKRRDFIRTAISEKLARDFGETASPVLTRGEQGRRTDLERLRGARERAKKRIEAAENDFHKAKTEHQLFKKMSVASKNAVLTVNLIFREAEILAAENKAVAEKLAAWRAAEAAYRAANKASARRELETRWVALCEAVESARA